MSSVFLSQGFTILAVILTLFCAMFFFFYNILTKREEKVKESWSKISVLYRKEIDLIPSLLSVVNAYARREQEAIESIISARTKAQELIAEIDGITVSSFEKVKDVQETDGLMMMGLRKIDDLKEEYPLLRSDIHYLTLENELKESQYGIKEARHKYNRLVKQYNYGLKLFPLNVITSLFNFEDKAYFNDTN